MLTNYHTHTNMCDGKNTAEEMVLSAIDKGFDAIGFSGHGYTDFDLSYCVKDMGSYISLINGLKKKYKNKIQIYMGVEEDAGCYVNRADFDYIIGSSHYFNIDGQMYPIDCSVEYFEKGIQMYNGDTIRLAHDYYSRFCEYILRRKPDIVGHFDLITKYDELGESRLLNNADYIKLAEKYIIEALKSECIFEVNTGAISRGYRKNPYPQENLLHIICKNGGKITLSSDCHDANMLECQFAETKAMLKDVGFTHTYVLYDHKWIKDEI